MLSGHTRNQHPPDLRTAAITGSHRVQSILIIGALVPHIPRHRTRSRRFHSILSDRQHVERNQDVIEILARITVRQYRTFAIRITAHPGRPRQCHQFVVLDRTADDPCWQRRHLSHHIIAQSAILAIPVAFRIEIQSYRTCSRHTRCDIVRFVEKYAGEFRRVPPAVRRTTHTHFARQIERQIRTVPQFIDTGSIQFLAAFPIEYGHSDPVLRHIREIERSTGKTVGGKIQINTDRLRRPHILHIIHNTPVTVGKK